MKRIWDKSLTVRVLLWVPTTRKHFVTLILQTKMTNVVVRALAATVWPEQIWIKVSSWWQIPPQHQSTYLGGSESASIEIPPFRPFLWCKFSKTEIFKKFWIAPNFFFCFTILKNLFLGQNFFVPEKKSC